MSLDDIGVGAKPDHRFDSFGCEPWAHSKNFVPHYNTISQPMNDRIHRLAKELKPSVMAVLKEAYPRGTIYVPTHYENRGIAQLIRAQGNEHRVERLRDILEDCLVNLAWTQLLQEEIEDELNNLKRPHVTKWMLEYAQKSGERYLKAWDLAICLKKGVLLGHTANSAPAQSAGMIVPSSQEASVPETPEQPYACDVGMCGCEHTYQ